MIKKIKKEQLLMIALAAVLMLVILVPIPEKEKASKSTESLLTESEKEDSLEQQLEKILEKISGVGKVEVLLTYEDQGKVVIEKDLSVSEELVEETDSSGGNRKTTTTRNESETVYDQSDSPYVIQKISPSIQGVLVVAQGGADPNVKNRIQETIQALFGLDSHKISIMKMEVTK